MTENRKMCQPPMYFILFSLTLFPLVQEEEKLIQRELLSIKEQVSSPNTTMVFLSSSFFSGVLRKKPHYLIKKIQWGMKLLMCLLLPFVTIWFRGRWRSSWCEPSTVKCWATRLHSAIFMPLNWLSKAPFWKRESVCIVNNSFLTV